VRQIVIRDACSAGTLPRASGRACPDAAGQATTWFPSRPRPSSPATAAAPWTADQAVTASANATDPGRTALQLANSETGVMQELPAGLAVSDLTQAFGKVPFAFNWLDLQRGRVSAHKLGGPKGIGALVLRRGLDVAPQLKGGGQEMGRRSGTENLIGIAGFGAAAEAAARDLADGVWDRVEQLRNILDQGLSASGFGTISVGIGARRLPNTLCLIAPGWKGETQVMQMDLAGFAVSAGSACSSGKVRASRVLRAMGFDDAEAASAIRLSLGPDVTEAAVLACIEAWTTRYRRHRARVA
jgi:cysteine desulfurase